MSKADSPRQRGWTLRGYRSAALRTSSRARVTIVSQGRSGARTGCRQSPRQLTRVAGRPGDGPQLPPGIASVADKLEQVGVERLLVRTADTVRSFWISLEGGVLDQLCGFLSGGGSRDDLVVVIVSDEQRNLE